MVTYAQKSSTVSNLEISRRFACQVLLLSFLKNQSAHLKVKSTYQKNDSFASMVLALLTIAKRERKPMCPLTDEWINRMWYTHTMK